ncbi:MAG TPA: hypothetical protein VGJ18_03220 [Gemmatimonadaceae bacterium]|jgi:hypothetical protein
MMTRIIFSLLAAGGIAAGVVRSHTTRQSPPLVVHEWGTITTRHLPDGTPQGRLNHITPAEVLPAFVHQYEPPATVEKVGQPLLKSVVAPGRQDVTMRLETPVIYFHAPTGASVAPFDVSVRFRGGVLNEFYPSAEPSVDLDRDRINRKLGAAAYGPGWNGEVLDNYVVGGLRWRGVTLQDGVRVPRTDMHVWLAPRQVRSAGVVVGSRESEQYLFYRGVAHLDALMQTELTDRDVRLRAPRLLEWMRSPTITIANVWLADIRPDGSVAFREQGALSIAKSGPLRELARIPLFTDKDYGEKRADLRRGMKQSLMAAGLYEDEAEAMLETWKGNYFETPGLRIFYIVPDEWISYFLPLQISAPNELKRVLVGRIDLEREPSSP